MEKNQDTGISVWIRDGNHEPTSSYDLEDFYGYTIESAQTSVQKPDLVITQIVGMGMLGGPLNLYYTIKNQGNAVAGPSHTGLYINGNYIKKDPVSALAPGASIIAKSFNYTRDCNAGEEAEIKVCADIATQVDESDETNNCKIEVWTCP